MYMSVGNMFVEKSGVINTSPGTTVHCVVKTNLL